MSGGILCKGVVLKVHRVINYNSMYIIIGYDVSTPLMTMYEIMTLCKHRMIFSENQDLCTLVMIEVCAQQGWSVERKITKEHAKKSQNVLKK